MLEKSEIKKEAQKVFELLKNHNSDSVRRILNKAEKIYYLEVAGKKIKK